MKDQFLGLIINKGIDIVTLEEILFIVSNFTGVSPEKILMRSGRKGGPKGGQKREIVEARQICITSAKLLRKSDSLDTIGQFFGDRNHATVIHAVKTVNSLYQTNRVFKEKCQPIETELNNRITKKNEDKISLTPERIQEKIAYHRIELDKWIERLNTCMNQVALIYVI